MTHPTPLKTLAFSLLLAPSLVFAPAALADDEYENDLADSETSYKGAQIMEGDVDIVLGDVMSGSWGDADDLSTYGFFSGNTLYAGAEDYDGNNVDMIGEFFWFESSIDRGSDFYLGVFKVRTSPNLEDFELPLEHDPCLYMVADTDLSYGTGAFRWDWSIPFENYGIDSYGEATLGTSYGLGANVEGSVMESTTTDEEGATVEGTIQAKGFLQGDYKVSAQYQVTLWRWEVDVHATPGSMEWDMYLNTSDRQDQNAYHEFFLVMQSEKDEPFVIDWLEVGGTVSDDFWWWENELSVALTDVTLVPPVTDDATGDDDDDVEGDDDDDDDEVEGDDDNEGGDVAGGPPDHEDLRDLADEEAPDAMDDGVDHNGIDRMDDGAGCNAAGTTTSPLMGTILCGMVLWMVRRRNG